MLTESLLLASLGAVLGIVIAFYATDYLDAAAHNLENPIPSWMRFSVDGPVLAFVVGATVFAALVSGFVPAWLSSRANALDVLKEGGRGNTGRAVVVLTRGLVVAQIVVTSVLLIGALLQMQSLVRQQHLDYGYDTGAVLAARMGLMEGDYPDSARRQVFFERLLRELRAAPQFAGAAFTNRFRMVFSGGGPVEIEGRDYPVDSDRQNAQFENVTPGYFDVLGVRLLEGRDFTDADSDQREPVAIVNARFARKYFGTASALGRRFRTTLQNGNNPGPWRTVVGVVSDVRMQGPFPNAQADGSGFYVPWFAGAFGPAAAAPVATQFATVIVRPPAGQRPEALAGALQAAVNRIDPNLPLYFVGTPRRALDAFVAQNRIAALMFGVFGLVAVALAAVGLYGVMSFAVNQRTQEFGIRMALGADTRTILGMVLRQGAVQLTLGLAIGLALAVAIALLFRTGIGRVLVNTSPLDPLAYTAVALLLAVVALVAALVPARRATRVDPMTALRAE
jgi:predicted permease